MKMGKHKYRRFYHGIYFFLLCFIWLIVMPLAVKAEGQFELHLLDVGQGQSVLINANGHYMLVDGGGRDSSSKVVSYLFQQGVSSLDCIVLSHYDEDHMGGIIGALSAFSCQVLLLPDYTGETELYGSFAKAAISNGCVIMHAKAGNGFQIGGAEVEVVGPVQQNYIKENDKSLVLRLSYGNIHYLIGGDAEEQSELDIASSDQDISADVYIVDHHGGSTSSMDIFLDAVSPRYALVSCGLNNEYGHPSMEALQRLKNHGISLFRTDLQGTVVLYSDGNDTWFNQDPTDDWSSVRDSGTRSLPFGGISENDEAQEKESAFTYVCNVNTKKFHYSDCESVSQIKEKNRLFTDKTREELIEEGYEPCGSCNP